VRGLGLQVGVGFAAEDIVFIGCISLVPGGGGVGEVGCAHGTVRSGIIGRIAPQIQHPMQEAAIPTLLPRLRSAIAGLAA
jgi:hypothetical protein